MKATRPINITEDSPVHFASSPYKGDLACDPERAFGALWRSPVDGDEITHVAGHADLEENFRFTFMADHVTCTDCLKILVKRMMDKREQLGRT